MATSIIDDLYRYNDWANERVFRLAATLSDHELDQPRDLGPGTLRATLYHLWTAEEIWLDRWQLKPWRIIDADPRGLSVEAIGERLQSVAAARRTLIEAERATQWQRLVRYQDMKKNEAERVLRELLVHVANHGIHHRAQVLSYLRGFGRTIPVGIDYVFYRIARPTVAQPPEALAFFQSAQLEVASGPGVELAWDRTIVQRYFAYHDWATQRLLDLVAACDDAALDRPFAMGPGSIRKTLIHLHDVEPFWYRNWTVGGANFQRTAPSTSIADLRASWHAHAQQRNRYVADINDAEALRVIAASFGGPVFNIQVLESMLQIVGHGTHHRAQAINMARQCGLTVPLFDYALMLRDEEEASRPKA